MIILEALTFPIFFVLSFIIPKKKRLYIFSSVKGKSFYGNGKTMFLKLSKNKDKKYYFLSRNKAIISELKNRGFNGIYINSILGIRLFLRAEYIFLDGGIKDIFFSRVALGNFKIINLRHGEPLKKINLSGRNIKKSGMGLQRFLIKLHYKYVYKFGITCSDASQKNMLEAFGNYFPIHITGLPRNDVFLNNDLEFFDISNKLGTNKYKKVILYAPTFRDTGNFKDFSKDFLDKIQDYCEKEKYLFLIKYHPFMKTQILDEKYTNIKNISKEILDIQEILKYTDILITDYSSVYIDYLLTEKPIIFYSYDLDDYLKNNRSMYFKYNDVILNKTLCIDENQLMQQIIKINELPKNKEYNQEYKKILNKFHHHKNGNSINRILNYL